MTKVQEQINYYEKCILLLPDKRKKIKIKYIWELKEKKEILEDSNYDEFTFSLGVEKND
jgi:hypothetical protein